MRGLTKLTLIGAGFLVHTLTCVPVESTLPDPVPHNAAIPGFTRADVVPELLQIWLDFEGGDLRYKAGCGGLAWDQTCNKGTEGAYSAFSGDATVQAVIASELERIFAPYNTRITKHRPAIGAVVHVVFTDRGAYIERKYDFVALGFATVDCANYNPTGTVFVQDIGELGALSYAATAAHEVGHTLGFEHSSTTPNVMNRSSTDGSLFLDACVLVDDEKEPKCSDADRAWLGCAPGQRNYHQELMVLTWPPELATSVE